MDLVCVVMDVKMDGVNGDDDDGCEDGVNGDDDDGCDDTFTVCDGDSTDEDIEEDEVVVDIDVSVENNNK